MSTRPECFIGQVIVRRGFRTGLHDCDGPWDRHHLIRKNRIKQELADEIAELAVEDERNMVLTCRRHHELVERALVQLRMEDLPHGIHDFVADFRLEGWLFRYFRSVA